MNSIHKNLTFLRGEFGFTQVYCSDKMGVKASSWNNWEKGLSAPKLDTIIELSIFFEVSIDDLLKVDLSEKPSLLDEPSQEYGKMSPCSNCSEKDTLINTQKTLIDSLQSQIKLMETIIKDQ